MDSIEVAHGDGLQGPALTMVSAHIATLNGLKRRRCGEARQNRDVVAARNRHYSHLKNAWQAGARVVRVATHCTKLMFPPSIFSMPASSEWTPLFSDDEPYDHAGESRQAGKAVEGYGATCIYVVDSGGAMNMAISVTVSAP